MTHRPRFRTALLLVVLGGCANASSIQGGMSSEQVRAMLGRPETVHKSSDGSETWEYPSGPLGRRTYMVTLGANQAVREVRQVLSDEYFAKVSPGMSRDQVRLLLGRPCEITMFPARDEEVWSWRYEEQGPMLFHALFDRSAGTVRTTLREEEGLSQPDE